jgi:endoribonuclease Dicer
MTDLETERLAARTSREFVGDIAVTRADLATEAVRRVQEIVQAHKFGAIDPKAEGLSAKVKSLHEILSHAFTMDGTKRCIVFVEKRYTARLLSDLYSQPSMRIPGMSASYMVSSSLSG